MEEVTAGKGFRRVYSKTAQGRTKYRTITKETIDGVDYMVYQTFVEIKPSDTKKKINWEARDDKSLAKRVWSKRPPVL